jgi:hypothetical protein
MVPVLGWEVEEGEQRFPILRQASDRRTWRRICRRTRRSRPRPPHGSTRRKSPKVGFHIDLNREGDLVQHVGGLVNPTALVPSALEDLFDRLPEAEHTVADREVRRNLEHTLLDVERSSRQLCALSRTPVWKPTSSSEETLPGTSFRVKRSAARWGNNSSD